MEKSNSFSFVDYKQTIFKLSTVLRRLRDFSEKLNLDQSIQSIDAVLQRLETNSFSIAVVGEFKRGKSTFINALLGRAILPSDILPTTATLNRVTYGLQPLAKIRFKDGREEEIAIAQLTNYVTKWTLESETKAADVREAVVYYPIPYCQHNVDIIDTPGLSDDESMTAVTLSILPYVDAAILVIMAQSPFSESERAFLENELLKEDLGRIIFVVTGIDRCNRSEDADKVIKSVEERLKKYVLQNAEQQFGKDSEEYKAYLSRIGQPRVFGISAYQALQAKQTADPELLAQSRFGELETALETFLTLERGAISLQVPVNRAIASAKEILTAIGNQATALKNNKQELRATYEAAVANLTAQQRANQQTKAILEQFKQGIRQFLNQVETEIQQAATQAIDSTMLTAYDLNQAVILERMLKLDRKVAEELESQSRKLAGRVQIEVQRGLTNVEAQIQSNTDEVRQLLNAIGMQFVNMGGSLRKSIVEGRIAWRVASTSTGGGNWLSQRLVSSDPVTTFKSNYKKAILEEIAKQLKLNPIAQQVYNSVANTLDLLKSKASLPEESVLTESQNSLAQLRVKLERDETLIDLKCQELDQMFNLTQTIFNDAQILSEQLMQVMGVAVK
ncbi:hypothetical protein NIES2107_52820 [Nostoc carneum NIES-2107]|nr:hypothetical protein NIES2107_52820 [Nostoc carneum NIES-2107]